MPPRKMTDHAASRRAGLSLITAAVLAALLLPAAGASAASCPNQAIQEEQHAGYLPDCRGYELASPVNKNEEEVQSPDVVDHQVPFDASAEGAGLVFGVLGALPGSLSGAYFQQYLAGSSGLGSPWQTLSLDPESRFGLLPAGNRSGGEFSLFSPDLSCGVEHTRLPQAMHSWEEAPQLPPGETAEEQIENLYAWHAASDSYALVTNVKPDNPTSTAPAPYYLGGASTDCGQVTFESAYQFLGASPGTLYEWSDNALRVASVLPDGDPTPAVPNNKGETGSDLNAVSSDGSRVFFTARANEGIDAGENEVFVRENANATIEVSSSKATPAVRDARARFQAASKDGSQVFFTGSYGLTTTSSTGATTCSSATGAGCDLYRYDVNTGALTDISADVHSAETGDTTGADVLGVLGISEEGADVYFSASGQLVPGKGGTQAANTADGQANVYVYHGGQLFYVASIGAPEAGASAGLETTLDAIAGPHGLKFMVSRVSPDGTYLLFATSTPITQSDGVTYDNIDEITGKPDPEEYEYSLAAGSVTCVSCEPGGHQPVTWEGVIEQGLLFGVHGPYIPVYEGSVPRNLSDKGQVFFDSFTPLVQRAKNGTVNAYEWEPEGVGTCPPGRAAGCVSLLDSGTDPNGSYFEGASADGASAYVSTYAQLAYPDEDGLRDIYVVREDGGAPVPIAPPPCTGEGCQGALAPGLSVSTPGSASGSGGGNLASPPSPPPARAGKAAVEGFTARAVHGYTVDVSVSAPSRGRISASGAGLTGVKRSVAKAGVYKLKLSLTAAERRALTRKKKLKLEIRVGFVPSAGAASSSTFAVTFIRQ